MFYPHPSVTLKGQWLLVQIMLSQKLHTFAKPFSFANAGKDMRGVKEL